MLLCTTYCRSIEIYEVCGLFCDFPLAITMMPLDSLVFIILRCTVRLLHGAYRSIFKRILYTL